LHSGDVSLKKLILLATLWPWGQLSL